MKELLDNVLDTLEYSVGTSCGMLEYEQDGYSDDVTAKVTGITVGLEEVYRKPWEAFGELEASVDIHV